MPNRRHAAVSGRDSVAREALTSAIAALQSERQKLTQLEQARERAREQTWGLPDKVANAALELREAREGESSRLALEYASGGITSESPISVAQLELDQAKSEQDRITRVEAALDSEIAQVNARLQRREAALHES
jgi:hypothetical protein